MVIHSIYNVTSHFCSITNPAIKKTIKDLGALRCNMRREDDLAWYARWVSVARWIRRHVRRHQRLDVVPLLVRGGRAGRLVVPLSRHRRGLGLVRGVIQARRRPLLHLEQLTCRYIIFKNATFCQYWFKHFLQTYI